MQKLLAAMIAGLFTVASVAPAVAADKKDEKAAKKDEKKDEKAKK